MTRSPSTEFKPSKRKGARSVSTLSPTQLARKRANDREAQRAIRARTKEHIEQLERELEELRNRHSRDETVQELLRRNMALEKELAGLRDTLALPPSRTLGSTPYQDESSPSCSGDSSRAPSLGQTSADYNTNLGTPYIPASAPREAWGSVLPCAVPSLVSSPASSSSNAEDYMAGYIPTSVPTSIADGGALSQPVLPCLARSKAEYDDYENDGGYTHHAAPRTPGPVYNGTQQPWALYGMYYPTSPAL